MIIKFCFQSEIHRSSNPPDSFEGLPAFLKNMFKTELPVGFTLQYITPEGDALPLTEDVYEQLKTIANSKPFKVVIVDENAAPEIKQEAPVEEKIPSKDDFEVLDNVHEPENREEVPVVRAVDEEMEQPPVVEQQVVRDEKEIADEMAEKLAEDLTKVNIMPKLEGAGVDEAYVKGVVNETLKEMMPAIMAHVKHTLQAQYQHDPQQANHNAYYPPQFQQKPKNFQIISSEKIDLIKEKSKNLWSQAVDAFHSIPEKVDKGVEKIGGFASKIPEAMDTLNQKIAGDPYVVCEEGRYPKSVVTKGYQLKEIFCEDETKDLLEFTSKMPFNATLEQLADVYAAYKQMKEEKAQKVNEENEVANEEKLAAAEENVAQEEKALEENKQ